MSDRFGLVTLPATTPSTDPNTTATGDPLLDVLGAYLMAAVNADTKALWAHVHAAITPPHAEPLPIVKVFTHDPDEGNFRSNALPALFLWRQGFPRNVAWTQDLDKSTSTIALLWVPPLAKDEHRRIRQAFRNAVAKAITKAMRNDRHPAYVKEGDTDPLAADYGTFILPALGATRIDFVDAKPFDLQVEARGGRAEPYDALLCTIEVEETLVPLKDEYDPIDRIEGTVRNQSLAIDGFSFKPTILSVTPSSGPAAGGTAITVVGHQFFDDPDIGELVVKIGGVKCTGVELVDGDTITAKTPAGSAGAKDVIVTLPSGASSAPLVGGFTHV